MSDTDQTEYRVHRLTKPEIVEEVKEILYNKKEKSAVRVVVLPNILAEAEFDELMDKLVEKYSLTQYLPNKYLDHA